MPETKTALVTGATGLLGRQVLAAFQRDSNWKAVGQGFSRVNGTDIVKADLMVEDEVVGLLDQTKPDVVVHCAANRFPDKCDTNPTLARALNVSATTTLASATSARHILLLYISTDYVFPGRPGEAPYLASAPPAPPNIYGQTKRDGELAVLEAAGESGLGVVLRVPVLYGPVAEGKGNSESAVNVLVDAVWKVQEQGVQVKMDDWAVRYPTHTADVARVCRDVAGRYLSEFAEGKAGGLPKILQFSSEDRMTKYQMCEVFAKILNLPLAGMVRVAEGPGEGEVQRPYDTHLDTGGLKGLGIEVATQDFEAWW
ncbi:hypothetical protein FQN50_000406 [Emmonsiellopsis sp. PD_5]|nr:hypothetical protein FQN50_000406 [Emmonsiellopsis sp. PD_5]